MTVLEQHLAKVGSRYRRADLWRYSAWMFVAAALVGLGLFYLQISAQWMHGQAGWLLLLGGIAGVLCVACALATKYRDVDWLVGQVEDNYPELDKRLVTTLDEVKKNKGKPLGYLQHTVLLETVSHAHNNNWQNLVSNQTMNSLRTRCLAAFALLMASAICLMQFRPPDNAFLSSLSAAESSEIEAPVANFEVLVEPGDVELEKGENLIVVARFGKLFPKEVQLAFKPLQTSGEAEVQSAPMQQSLDDPLFGGTVYEVTEPIEYFVTYDGNETKHFQVGVYVLPELVRSDAEIEFPSYTELPNKIIEDTRRASAVEGSLLTWKVHVNKPGVTATLVPKKDGGEEIALEVDPTSPTTFSTQMRLTKTQSWHLKLLDADGRENRSPPSLTAKVTPNLPAKVKLELARDARVSPIEEFLVKATVSDDYGLSKAGISYMIKGEEKEVTLVEDVARREKSPAEYMLDFESLDAEPDQLLSYHFWAEDQDANGEARRTMSDMYHTKVRHFEEIFRQGQQPNGEQQQQQQQEQQQQGQSQNAQDAEQLAEVQKQIVNASWNILRRGMDETFQEDVSVVLESQQAAIEQATELAQNLEDAESKDHLFQAQEFMQRSLSELTSAYSDKSVDSLRKVIPPARGAYEALLKLRAREHEVVQQQQQQQQQQQSQSASRQRFQQQLNQLELENDQNRYETQRQAQDEATEEQQEMRRAMNQLKELAQRQEDLNKQLKELQNALEQAESEQEREEIERQLKRLRDQQEEMLRDTDELMDRLEEGGDEQEAMQEAQEQLEQTREQMRESSEALERGEVTPALASGTRAQRELEEMQEELRRASANQFSEQMREMRDEARDIEERQQELGEQLSQRQEQNTDQQKTGLRSQSLEDDEEQQETKELRDALRVQQRRVDDLLEEMKQTVEEAAESEPLLAEGLYDAVREAEKDQLEDKLEATAQLTERGLTEQAQRLEEDVREGIDELAEEIDNAADQVLGDQSEALRVAIQTLKDLENELRNEMEQFGGESNENGEQQDGQPRQQGDGSPTEQGRQEGNQEGEPSEREGDQEAQSSASDRDPDQQQDPQNGEPREGQPGEPQEGEPQNGEPQQGQGQQPGNQPGNQEQQDREQQQNAESQPPQEGQGQQEGQQGQGGRSQQESESQEQQQNQDAQGQRGQRQPGQQRSLRGGSQPNANEQNGGIGADWGDRLANPITGDDFREWSDRLRDVEELVDDPELRAEAARIREQARNFRRDFKRHSEEPKWDLINELVSRPLRELRGEVSAELMRRAAEKNAIVPIDKDPVPQQFTEQVRRYYENLGAADSDRSNE